MRKHYLYAILSFMLFGPLHATHIVGGEFQLKHIRGYNFKLDLRMYYDDINADPGLLYSDLKIKVAIYKKVNPGFPIVPLEIISMDRSSDIGFIQYNYNLCSDFNSSKVKTRLFTYSKDIYLDPDIYNDPGGYYVVWEKCCRNVNISNIVDPSNTGNAFYLEFPPVVDANGNRFANSSPTFKPITGDFPCIGQPFVFPFGATDFDGDSLTYQLVTPLAGSSFLGNSTPTPPSSAPFDSITWVSPYKRTNQIPGSPALTVDKFGVLHVTPANVQALFAIAMRVDEYRGGVKIGSVRRDFQFNVIDCPYYKGPIIDLQKPGGGLYANGDTLELKVETDTCFTLIISDSSDTERNLSIQTIQTNIPSSILSISRSFKAKRNVFLKTPFCFDACRKLNIDHDTTFFLEVVVQDEQCPAPKTDTLRLSILYKPQINSKPVIDLDTISSLFKRNLLIGDVLQFNVIGTDSNITDILTLSGSGEGFNLGDYGMNFNTKSGTDSIVSPFYWKVPCKALDRSPFKINFVVKDNSCIVTNKDTVLLVFYVHDTVTTIDSYVPPNLITPNGDGKNDYFQLVNLPIDNCAHFFAGVQIYNRWGAKIYESYERNFKWDPSEFSDGMYYYLVNFNSKKVKGWLQVVR